MSFDVETYLKGNPESNVILYYKGNVDSDLINYVLDTVEEKLAEMNEQPRLRKKVYNVLVESLQNLYHHVDKVPEDFEDQNSEKFGILLIEKSVSGFKIVTGNFVQTDNAEELKEKIMKINRSTRKEIKELYKFILNNQRLSAKGGGGLGLVDIARKTGNKLDYTLRRYNDQYFFFYLDILIAVE
ncbi:MAG: hypothetical protein GX158_09745 [Bacteroidales bacterium]|nr:hypothetical protein [Bacteroidales bacterium]